LLYFQNKKVIGNEKLEVEIKYVESRIIGLLNVLNNINIDNYKISSTQLNLKKDESESSSSENKESSNGSSQQKDSNKTQENQSELESGEQYNLEESGILNNNQKTLNWKSIKHEVENIYTVIPTITLDLYNASINQEDILNFNKELDVLAVAVKNENKEESLKNLAKMYAYIPIYYNACSNDNIYTTILRTKESVINAYVLVNDNNWQEISNYVKKALEIYTPVLNDIQNNEKDSTINKAYIILNEINNAVELKDREIFLIKYKYLIEELEAIT